MDIDLKYLYLQSKYRKLNDNKKDIFPNEWFNIKNYPLKKKILEECINKNILIVNSSYYYEFRTLALN